MLAMLLTIVFLAAAVLALATIAASFAKGFVAVSSMRRQLALCEEGRMVTIRHERAVPARAVVTLRAGRRPSRPASALAPQARRRAAA
jgi:hypothetical protein